jgi:hypothetical protein
LYAFRFSPMRATLFSKFWESVLALPPIQNKW